MEVGLIGVFMILAAAAAMWFSTIFDWEFAIVSRALPIFALAMANIYVGLALVLMCYPSQASVDGRTSVPGSANAGRQRRIALALCAIDAAVLGLAAMLGLNAPQPNYEDRLFVSLIVVGATLFLIAAFRLGAWRAMTPAAASRNLSDPVAIVLLVNGVFGFWAAAMNGIFSGVSQWADLYWQLLELPLDLAMIAMARTILSGTRRLAPQVLIAAICSISAVLSIGDLWTYASEQTFEFNLLDAIGIFLDVTVLAFILAGYRRTHATVGP
jgi:hypothetical protein